MKLTRFIKGYLSSAPIWHVPHRQFIFNWMIPLCAWRYKGKLKCPDDTTIVLIHDRDYETFTEKSLKYIGINNYIILRPKGHNFWHHNIKIKELYKWLPKCKTKYIIYLDSDDVIIKNNNSYIPPWGITFSSDGFHDIYPGKTDGKRYLCAGVFMGETENIKRLILLSMAYVRDYNSLDEWIAYKQSYRSKLRFPVGYDDQRIFRYLSQFTHLDISIDFGRKLVYR